MSTCLASLPVNFPRTLDVPPFSIKRVSISQTLSLGYSLISQMSLLDKQLYYQEILRETR
uniref:Uncharacterized protein n=1 Tax=Picea glauca TaxID=3330 RepID=A0A117NG11_PICGL|nr:hypothetical protein ABT39_MTgene1891 [Picea glauca]QHR92532.1 hypothetical protein Q903MT_gene6578 [Picea sitchensis]